MIINIVEAILIGILLFGYLWFSIHSPAQLGMNRWVQLFYNLPSHSNAAYKKGQLNQKHQKVHHQFQAKNDLIFDYNTGNNDAGVETVVSISPQTNNSYHIKS